MEKTEKSTFPNHEKNPIFDNFDSPLAGEFFALEKNSKSEDLEAILKQSSQNVR